MCAVHFCFVAWHSYRVVSTEHIALRLILCFRHHRQAAASIPHRGATSCSACSLTQRCGRRLRLLTYYTFVISRLTFLVVYHELCCKDNEPHFSGCFAHSSARGDSRMRHICSEMRVCVHHSPSTCCACSFVALVSMSLPSVPIQASQPMRLFVKRSAASSMTALGAVIWIPTYFFVCWTTYCLGTCTRTWRTGPRVRPAWCLIQTRRSMQHWLRLCTV